VNALKLLQPIKDKYSGVTYADLFQLASATAIEVSHFSYTFEKVKIDNASVDFCVIHISGHAGGWWSEDTHEVRKSGCNRARAVSRRRKTSWYAILV